MSASSTFTLTKEFWTFLVVLFVVRWRREDDAVCSPSSYASSSSSTTSFCSHSLATITTASHHHRVLDSGFVMDKNLKFSLSRTAVFPQKETKMEKLFKNQKTEKIPLSLPSAALRKDSGRTATTTTTAGVGGQKTKSTGARSVHAFGVEQVSLPPRSRIICLSRSKPWRVFERKERREFSRRVIRRSVADIQFDESGSGWLQSVQHAIASVELFRESSAVRDGTGKTGTNKRLFLLDFVEEKEENEATVHLVEVFESRGLLMKAIFSADSNNLVQFAFPLERLPSKTQRMLQTHKGRWN